MMPRDRLSAALRNVAYWHLGGHRGSAEECPLLGVKRTLQFQRGMSAVDPERTLLGYRVDKVRWGAVVEHCHEHIARF
jgi:hypothetical protein